MPKHSKIKPKSRTSQEFPMDHTGEYRSVGRSMGGIPVAGVPWYEMYYGVSFGGYGGYYGMSATDNSSEESNEQGGAGSEGSEGSSGTDSTGAGDSSS